MLKNKQKEWWRASDFQRPVNDIFVGYEATARMSELVKMFEFAFSVRRNGRFREIRFKFENAKEIHKQMGYDMGRHLVIEKIIV